MDSLGAALAFAITMLVLSTVVTTTVETIHRIIGLREKGLRLMLEHLYDAVIARHVDRVFGDAEAIRGKFLDVMTANRAPAGDAGLPLAAKVGVSNDRKFLSWIWGGRRLGSLSVEDFMARLGDSHFGDAVAQIQSGGGTAAVDVVLQDLAHKFEAFGRDASEYFQARARLVSVLVALVIAWQCYVNPMLLAQTFLRDPKVTTGVIELGKKYLDQPKPAEQKPSATVGAAAANQPPLAPVAAPTAEQSPSASRSDAGAKNGKDDAERDPEQRVDELRALGVPIGWTEERVKHAGFDHTWFWFVYPVSSKALPTVAWLLLGGLLIGLGSPFWRDAVLSLTAFRDRAKTATAEATAIGRDPVVLAAERFVKASQARAATLMASTDSETDIPVG